MELRSSFVSTDNIMTCQHCGSKLEMGPCPDNKEGCCVAHFGCRRCGI